MVGTFLSSEKEGTISLKGSLDEAQAIAPTAPKISLLKPLWPSLNPVGNYNEESRRIARQITKKSV